jgi:hypothetical protein
MTGATIKLNQPAQRMTLFQDVGKVSEYAIEIAEHEANKVARSAIINGVCIRTDGVRRWIPSSKIIQISYDDPGTNMLELIQIGFTSQGGGS